MNPVLYKKNKKNFILCMLTLQKYLILLFTKPSNQKTT